MRIALKSAVKTPRKSGALKSVRAKIRGFKIGARENPGLKNRFARKSGAFRNTLETPRNIRGWGGPALRGGPGPP
jgi:hypothetical protein